MAVVRVETMTAAATAHPAETKTYLAQTAVATAGAAKGAAAAVPDVAMRRLAKDTGHPEDTGTRG